MKGRLDDAAEAEQQQEYGGMNGLCASHGSGTWRAANEAFLHRNIVDQAVKHSLWTLRTPPKSGTRPSMVEVGDTGVVG